MLNNLSIFRFCSLVCVGPDGKLPKTGFLTTRLLLTIYISGCVTLLQLATGVVGTPSGCSEVIDQNDVYLRCMQSFNRLFEDVTSLRAGPDKENATASVLCR